jgi:hypothetical protein
MDARGRTFSASIYISTAAPGNFSGTVCRLRAFVGPTATPANPTPFAMIPLPASASRSPVVPGSYFTLSGVFPTTAAASEVYVINVECFLPPEWLCCVDPNALWYIDDVSID